MKELFRQIYIAHQLRNAELNVKRAGHLYIWDADTDRLWISYKNAVEYVCRYNLNLFRFLTWVKWI